MSDLLSLPWDKLLRVSSTDLDNWLILHKENQVRKNLKVRFYRIKIDNEKIDENGFINYLLSTVQNYVFDQRQIDEIKNDGGDPFTEALKYFGDVDPIRDGRYGELILYILTEGILKTPLVVHKISHSYSANKQVEGSDGIFIGMLNQKISLLLGESKMRNMFSLCLPNAIQSINRFHDDIAAFEHEIKVARNHLSTDLNKLSHDGLTQLYNVFKITKPEFKQFNLSHPVLLIYKEKGIGKIEKELEKNILQLLTSKSQKIEKAIDDLSNHFKSEIILSFFLMPLNNVNDFRRALYKAFHNGQDYLPKGDNQ